MTLIPVLVNGAKGKMGQEVSKALRQEVGLQLVGEAGREDNLLAFISRFSLL